jgi:uracil-DNA glycosylase
VGEASVWERIAACRLCAPRFATTATRHAPRPVVWFRPGARLLIASQAPGMRAHESGIPFQDASGERLREWMAISPDDFYDKGKVAIVPMGFCFPGYDAVGSDIPPPAICADHAPAVFALPHPSWRNTAWLRKNPWFGEEVLPALRARVREVLHD